MGLNSGECRLWPGVPGGADPQEKIKGRHLGGKVRKVLAPHGRMMHLEAFRAQEPAQNSHGLLGQPRVIAQNGLVGGVDQVNFGAGGLGQPGQMAL